MKKSYVVTEDMKTPLVRMTGHPRNPQRIEYKEFKKGSIVNGVMQYANGKPAFVLVAGALTFPLNTIKEVVTKDVVSNTTGEPTDKDKVANPTTKKDTTPPVNPKVKYIDALLIGAVVGAVGVHFAEKKGYIPVPDPKYKLYGAIAGGIIAWYIVYRQQQTKQPIVKPTEK